MKYSYLRGAEERNNVNSDESILLPSAGSASLNQASNPQDVGNAHNGLHFALSALLKIVYFSYLRDNTKQ
jgi:hypothetical protein